ncbi:MAG: hypothetical protein HY735_35425 [Verrucomicrobia bacterium]|nr:hypothetical protein [Verrucomicrobiota bacterium]
MFNRLAFGLIALFWATMNVLLWRLEFRGQSELGSDVPIGVVWRKILTAPDDSALGISHRGRKVGYCRWRANVGEELSTGKVSEEDNQPEGMIQRLSGYTIDLEGNLLLVESGARLRFQLHAGFSATRHWRDLAAKVSIRPRTLELQSSAASEHLQLTYTDGGEKWERQLRLSDFREPARLLREFGLPFPENLAGNWNTVLGLQESSLALQWEARNDWLQIGNSKVRVYRVQAKVLDRFQAVIIVSRVGEILRVDLSNGIQLMNDALINL